MITSSKFQPLNLAFSENMGAIRVFNQRIGLFADEQDKSVIANVAKGVAENMGIEADEIEKELLDIAFPEDILEVEVTEKLEGVIQELRTYESDSELRQKISEWEKSHPQQSSEISFILQSVMKNPPAQGRILRRSALVTLVSLFETLLSQLIHFYYLQHPDSLSEDKTLSLSEIRSAGSVQEAEKLILSKEAEAIIRRNLSEQLDYFEKRIGVDVAPLKAYQASLVEVIQRRNLFVHNDGIINHVYLSQTKYANEKSWKEGQRLRITRDYLNQAIDTVRLFGTILLQQCWRRWLKDEAEAADNALSESILDSLSEERYELTKKLVAYSSKARLVSKSSEYLISINHAIALKELGEREGWRKIVRELDLSSNLPIQFRIAIHVLRDEKDKAYSLLPTAIANGKIPSTARYWPIFKHMRDETRFSEIFEQDKTPPSEASNSTSDN